MTRARLFLLLVAVLLCGGALAAGWYFNSPIWQTQRHDAARALWEQRPFADYMITAIRHAPHAPSAPRSNAYRIYREQVSGTAQAGSQSVPLYFDLIERERAFSRPFRCDVAQCLSATSKTVFVRYDPVLGYPREIRVRRYEHPDWLNPAFWRWFTLQGGWQQCDNMQCTRTMYEYVLTIDIAPERSSPP